MFKKLLVPLDGSSRSAVALPLARTLAKATGGEIVLVRVIPDDLLGADPVVRAEAENSLAQIAKELAGAGVHVTTIVQAGANPAADITATVRRQGADLVVMATHGRTGLRRAVLGSVAERVLAESPVPVAVLRPGGHRVTHVTTLLVPVDGSPGASVALGLAVPLARTARARIVLLDVVGSVLQYAGLMAAGMAPVAPDPAWDDEALAAARSYVEGLSARLRKAGIEAEGRAVLGRAGATIVETANDVGADLIVMSTHALTGPARALLGSTADEVVREARRPVLLIRHR
ncbi:MAG TPA: universal stress protein [Chloroflexota bacterium]|nr:universal stress protein [Chloroflexota bacterium]